jgi:hypothetical protein
MATCKICGEPIKFILTRKGRRMPVDSESYAQHQLTAGVTVVTDGGDVLRGGRGVYVAATGYTPHWSTCTHPEQCRTRGSQE